MKLYDFPEAIPYEIPFLKTKSKYGRAPRQIAVDRNVRARNRMMARLKYGAPR